MQQRGQSLLLERGQRHQEWLDGRKTTAKQLLAQGSASLREIERDCTFIASLSALDETVGSKPIDKADRSRVGEAENTSQLVIGRAKAVTDNDERCGRFAHAVKDDPRSLLDAIDDSKRYSAQEIGSPVDHSVAICALGTVFNLTIRALGTYQNATNHFRQARVA